MTKADDNITLPVANMQVMTALVETLAASGQLDFAAFSSRLQKRADAVRHGDPQVATAIDMMLEALAEAVAKRQQDQPPSSD